MARRGSRLRGRRGSGTTLCRGAVRLSPGAAEGLGGIGEEERTGVDRRGGDGHRLNLGARGTELVVEAGRRPKKKTSEMIGCIAQRWPIP